MTGKRSLGGDVVVPEKCGWDKLFHIGGLSEPEDFMVRTVVCEMTVGTTYTAIA